jgi:hypothetical protein
MRTVTLGFLVVAGLVVIGAAAGAPDRREGGPQRGTPFQVQSTLANADMLVVSANVGDRYQQVTVIDPKLRVMSVYHIEFATGQVALRSVRNFHFDLQIKQYNGKDPLPEEIETLLAPK